MALGMQRVAHGLGNGDDLCSPECTRAMINDGRCDTACVTRACMWDGKDCECAPGCLATWLGDGECDAQCNNAVCDFDAGDCSEATVLPTAECSLGCLPSQLGDGTCHAPCNVARCQWDLGDCPLTRPAWPSSAVGGLTAGQQAGASRARDTVNGTVATLLANVAVLVGILAAVLYAYRVDTKAYRRAVVAVHESASGGSRTRADHSQQKVALRADNSGGTASSRDSEFDGGL